MYQSIYILCYLVSWSCYVMGQRDCSVDPSKKTQTLKLKEDLLCNYDVTVRPVIHHENKTVVSVTMLLRTLSVEEYSNSLDIHCWMIWEWTDEFLHWNPSDYGGVEMLHVDSNEVWVPEVAQFASTAAWEAQTRIPSGRCQVKANGHIVCVPGTVYFALCIPDLTYWPYDRVNCSLRLGAYMQSGEEIDLHLKENSIELFDFEENREWKLLSSTARRHLEQYTTNSTFPWIIYSFVMQRHSSMYEATITIPGIMFAVMVLTTFWIQPMGQNRINLVCVTLICHYLHLQYLGWILQSNGEKCPLVVLFYRDSMILSAISLVVAVVLRCLISLTTASPVWISGTTSWVLSYRPGQLLLLREIPKVSITTEDGKEERSDPVATISVEDPKIWTMFCKLIDTTCFLIFVFVYLFMIIRFFTF